MRRFIEFNASLCTMHDGPLVYLTTATSTFHSRVIAARLGADGIVCDIRGAVEGPYPLPGTVDIYVSATDEPLARELLLGDQVDAAFDLTEHSLALGDSGSRAEAQAETQAATPAATHQGSWALASNVLGSPASRSSQCRLHGASSLHRRATIVLMGILMLMLVMMLVAGALRLLIGG